MTGSSGRSARGSGLRTALRILNVRLRFIVLMLLTALLAARWDSLTGHWERWTSRASTVAATAEAVEYYCPMHPSVVRDAPGSCPICGMPLSKRAKGVPSTLPAGVLGRVALTPERIALGRIATSEVSSRALQRVIRAFGVVELEERYVAHISARVAGRVEMILADYPDGVVEEGHPMVELYSPDLIATEQEYLSARALAGESDFAGPVAAAARERLALWGIGEDEIARLEASGSPDPHIVIRSPIRGTIVARHVDHGEYVAQGADLYEVADLAHLWVTASIPEGESGGIHVGMPVTISLTSLPGRTFAGRIDFVEPALDPGTRSLRARARLASPLGELRPGMYAEMSIVAPIAGAASGGRGGARPGYPATAMAERYECPMKCDDLAFAEPGKCPVCGMELVKVESPDAGEWLTVPESAVIATGTRKVVYLEREPGVFDAVAVTLGALTGGQYPVLAGLSKGDRVVTQGTFLVDAELRLSPGAASSYFGATGTPGATGAPGG